MTDVRFTVSSQTPSVNTPFFLHNRKSSRFSPVSYRLFVQHLEMDGVSFSEEGSNVVGYGSWERFGDTAKTSLLFNNIFLFQTDTSEKDKRFFARSVSDYSEDFFATYVEGLVENQKLPWNLEVVEVLALHCDEKILNGEIQKLAHLEREGPIRTEMVLFLESVFRAGPSSVVLAHLRKERSSHTQNRYLKAASENDNLDEKTQLFVWESCVNQPSSCLAIQKNLANRTTDCSKIAAYIEALPTVGKVSEYFPFRNIFQNHNRPSCTEVRRLLLHHPNLSVRQTAGRRYRLTESEAKIFLEGGEESQIILASNHHLHTMNELVLAELAFSPYSQVRTKFFENLFIPEHLKNILDVAN